MNELIISGRIRVVFRRCNTIDETNHNTSHMGTDRSSSNGPLVRRDGAPEPVRTGWLRRAAGTFGDALRALRAPAGARTGAGSALIRRRSNRKQEFPLEAKVEAASRIVDLALYGGRSGGRSDMPPRSPFGIASHPSVRAFWEHVLQRPIADVAREFMSTAPFPNDSEERYLATSFEPHTRIYLAVAARSDPGVLERAVLALPKYTQFVGATGDPQEKKQINPATEIERLNRLFSGRPLPSVGKLQVNLIKTDTYETLEVTRYVNFRGTGKVYYSVGKDGVSYGISEEGGLSDPCGLLPDLAVVDPRALRFPTYSQLLSTMEREGRDIEWDVMETQKAKLPEFPPSGPRQFRYCSYEAQQSLATDLLGKDQACIDVVNNGWNTQLRLDVYSAAARSPDAAIRILGTTLLSLYPQAEPFLLEAANDSHPQVAEIARKALRSLAGAAD